MPNYNFECLNCHQYFEVRATIKKMEEGKISCTKCNSKDIRRIFNGFGFCTGEASSSRSSSSCSSCSSGSCSTCG